jgi:RNA polymerase sigma factor (TIGR02999 family)
MAKDSIGNITQLLLDWETGDKEALSKLMPIVYAELKKIACGTVKKLSVSASVDKLAPTILVHEAYLRLIDQSQVDWKDRAHFFAIAAREMRRVIIDEYRKSQSEKRGGNLFRVSLTNIDAIVADRQANRGLDLIALNRALDELGGLDERQAEIIDMHFFGGLSVEEIAELMAVSISTIERELRHGRRWLGKRLAGEQKNC